METKPIRTFGGMEISRRPLRILAGFLVASSLVSRPSWRTGAPLATTARPWAATTNASFSTAATSLPTPAVQVAPQVTGNGFQVHEVAESTPRAFPHLILAAASFTEVGDRTQLSVDWSAAEPTIIQIVDGFFGVFLAAELDVHVADEMITQVVTYVHFFDLTIFVFTFHKDVFKEVVIMFLHLFVRHIAHQMRSVSGFGGILRVDVQVLQKNSLAESRFVMDPGTPITMAARSDFKIK